MDGLKKEKLNTIKINPAVIIIGKNGLTEGLIDSIRKQLKKDKLIKVKILKTAKGLEEIGRKKFAEIIVNKVEANLIEIRGYNLILEKKR